MYIISLNLKSIIFVTKQQENRMEIFAIIQISTLETNYIIDSIRLYPLVKATISQIFSNQKILKLVYSCESDTKILLNYLNIQYLNFIDIKKLALEFNKNYINFGLSNLSETVLGIELDKSFQSSSWNLRPLLDAMKKYASLDCIVLFPIFYYFCFVDSGSFFGGLIYRIL